MRVAVTIEGDSAADVGAQMRLLCGATGPEARVSVEEFQATVARARECEHAADHYQQEAAALRAWVAKTFRLDDDAPLDVLLTKASEGVDAVKREAAETAKLYGQRLQAEGYDLAKIRDEAPADWSGPSLEAREASGMKGGA